MDTTQRITDTDTATIVMRGGTCTYTHNVCIYTMYMYIIMVIWYSQ